MKATAIRIAFALVLALACGQAAALGLGQIVVKSKLNEPFLAEIPIISNEPGELDQLEARLGSPETFTRIGLEPPQGAVADLQFAVVRNDAGAVVIRVTSQIPVDKPLLTFLVEVDSIQGKLVREYSALVDPPRNAPSPAGPVIEAPTAAFADEVVRPPSTPTGDPTSVPEESSPGSATAAQPPEAVPPQATPTETAAPPAPTAIPTPAPQVAEVPPAVSTAPAAAAQNEYGPVKAGQTLSQIVAQLGAGQYTVDQTMLALLRTNPEAFIGNDINRIKRGAVLRIPDAAEVTKLGAAEASVIVRDQIEQWRQTRRRPAAQPASIAGSDNASRPVTASAAAAEKRVAGARLEIMPPAADRATRAGTLSGASAGGEGDMQRQELQETKENLAAREAELQELKSRVADLEKLQQDQQKLITLKDSELAAAQQRLADSNRAATKTAVAPTPSTAVAQPAADNNGVPLWWWGGMALVLLGLGAWWFTRRGRVGREKPDRKPMDASLFEDRPPGFVVEVPAAINAPSVAIDHAVDAATQAQPDADAPPEALRWPASSNAVPTWHARNNGGDAATSDSPLQVGHERIELARAYLDLGDHDTARGLLQEIVQVGDPDARAEAVRLLQDLPK